MAVIAWITPISSNLSSFSPSVITKLREIIPNPERLRIYISGCSKSQVSIIGIGSPSPDGSKKEVFRFRSVSFSLQKEELKEESL